MSYKPRSGAFRKVKYAIRIYKDEEIPARDLKEVREMARKIKTEETSVFNDIQQVNNINNDMCNLHKQETEMCKTFTRAARNDPLSRKENLEGVKLDYLPQPEFSLVPDTLYDKLYPHAHSMPPFPVTSCSDPPDFEDDADVPEYDCESEYDMDSEDEAWLNENQSSHITPSRLEYIFSKLNKRDTHVPEKAIGALPPAVHPDFFHVFPYWKKKRLQNKNTSSFTSSFMQTDLMKKDYKLTTGYVPTDPFVAFACKVRKPIPQHSQPPLKKLLFGKRETAKLWLSDMTATRDKFDCLRSILMTTIQTGLLERDRIKNKITELTFQHQKYEGRTSGNEDREKKQSWKPGRYNITQIKQTPGDKSKFTGDSSATSRRRGSGRNNTRKSMMHNNDCKKLGAIVASPSKPSKANHMKLRMRKSQPWLSKRRVTRKVPRRTQRLVNTDKKETAKKTDKIARKKVRIVPVRKRRFRHMPREP